MVGEIYQTATAEDFARRAVELIATAGAAAVAARGRFVIALTGGRTVQPVYQQLAAASGPVRQLLAERSDYFWGDERLVPHDHPESNCGLAQRLLLAPLAVPPARQYPIPTALADPATAARAYEQELRDFFAGGLSPAGLPIFDLVLLGLGSDGHVASLFPGSPTLAEASRWVVEEAKPGLPPLLSRVSLALPVLNQARLVMVLVGGDRVALARRICSGEAGTNALPAARLRPAGRLLWLG